jgi:hypothetical protein
MYRDILRIPQLCHAVLAIRIALAASVALLAVAGYLVLSPKPKQASLLPPPRAAETACHMDLEAIGRTLPYVPLSPRERKAAHRLLRQAYNEVDDKRCREIGGTIIYRFVSTNRELWGL